jgi:adenylylsulfate kinase-like enzyme
MTILLLTGPLASGKTTVAAALASRDVDPLAVIELDTLRRMVVRSHFAPWDGEKAAASSSSASATTARSPAPSIKLSSMCSSSTKSRTTSPPATATSWR